MSNLSTAVNTTHARWSARVEELRAKADVVTDPVYRTVCLEMAKHASEFVSDLEELQKLDD